MNNLTTNTRTEKFKSLQLPTLHIPLQLLLSNLHLSCPISLLFNFQKLDKSVVVRPLFPFPHATIARRSLIRPIVPSPRSAVYSS